jgi:hypothetical protein
LHFGKDRSDLGTSRLAEAARRKAEGGRGGNWRRVTLTHAPVGNYFFKLFSYNRQLVSPVESLMRHLSLFIALALLAGCASSGGRPEDLDYAREALLQSVSAYQICLKENNGDPKECDGLAKLQNADEKRLERLNSQK